MARKPASFGALNGAFLIAVISSMHTCAHSHGILWRAGGMMMSRRKESDGLPGVYTRLWHLFVIGSIVIGRHVATEPLTILPPHTLPTLTHIGALNRWQAQQDYLGPLPGKATGTWARVRENRLSMCVRRRRRLSVTALWMPLKEMCGLVSRWFSSSDCQRRFKEDMEDFRISDF